MELQIGANYSPFNPILKPSTPFSSSLRTRLAHFGRSKEIKVHSVLNSPRLIPIDGKIFKGSRRKTELTIVASSSSSNLAAPFWDGFLPEKGSKAPSLSDIVWPSAGAFAAMAILGKVDQILAPKGISMTIAPLGSVSAVLFAAPSSPGARKYNVFMAQIGCAAIGVLAFTVFGPGWLARSSALAAAIAFMIYTRAVHPPAASLPLLFIDGAKLHHLNYWYAFFPGAAGCILLCLMQSDTKSGTEDLVPFLPLPAQD